MKKMITYLLAAVGLLLLIWAVLVVVTPKLIYRTSIRIEKPAEAVFGFIDDYANAPRWLNGLTDVQVTGGTPGTKGSTARYTFVENGRTVIFDEEVLAVEPGKSIEFRLKSDDLILHTYLEVVADGNAAILSMRNEVTPLSLVMRALNPFVKGMMRGRQEADLMRLKEILEQG